MRKLLSALLIICTVIFTACTAPEAPRISVSDIPQYENSPYVELDGNIPSFSEEEKAKTKSFEHYSRLDSLGRCGVAYANLGTDLMPTKKRGDISSIKPTGWVQKEYAFVQDGHIYNRCHLIAHMLAGEDANKRNLITGTRYMNVKGMLPFETEVAEYITSTDNHVLYRVTPVFEGDNLLANGVQMEGWSVEDSGRGICFNVYCYNVQPGVQITYATGNNKASGKYTIKSSSSYTSSRTKSKSSSKSSSSKKYTYVLNSKSMKFHYENCAGALNTSENNKSVYKGTRDEVIAMGYDPCGLCNP